LWYFIFMTIDEGRVVRHQLLTEIEPIYYGSGWPLHNDDDVSRFVESPLRKAVAELRRKNIQTRQASANKHDALSPYRQAYIELDIASLALGNSLTLSEIFPSLEMGEDVYGRVTLIPSKRLVIPVSAATTVEALERQALDLTDLLDPQEPWRAQPLTLAQAKQKLREQGEESVGHNHPGIIEGGLWGGRNETPYFYVADSRHV
jgi:hypothetical protein